MLKVQLLLKGIITEDDWQGMRNHIIVDFARDNHFTELKDSELLRERIQTLDAMRDYIGEYFSKEWVQKNVLHFTDDDIDNMKLGDSSEAPPQDQDGDKDNE